MADGRRLSYKGLNDNKKRLALLQKYESSIVGSLESPGLSHRCAFYGHGTLSINDMDSAYDRDGEAFTLAALCNETLYFNHALRGKAGRQTWLSTAVDLHGSMRIDREATIRLRSTACFRKHHIRDDEDAPVPPPSTEVLAIKALETKLAANRSMMLWGFVIVGLLIWMR